MRASGFTLNEIQEVTNIFGTLNSYTTFWSNQLYRGVLKFGDLVIENYCQAMIDEETWSRVQRLTEQSKNRMHMKSTFIHPRRVRSRYLLSGLAKCARCDSLLYGLPSSQRNGKVIDSYRCSKGNREKKCDLQRIPKQVVEDGILHTLLECLIPSRYLQICARANDSCEMFLDEQGNQLKRLQDEISNVHTKIDNLTAAIAASGHSRSLLDRLSDLEKQEVSLLTQLEQTKTVRERNPLNYSDGTLASYARQLAEKLESDDLNIRRRALQALVYEILIDRQEKHLICHITIYVGAGNNDDRNFLHKLITTFPVAK